MLHEYFPGYDGPQSYIAPGRRVIYAKGGKGGSPTPQPVPPPTPPVVEDADAKAEDNSRRDALRRGRASTVLSGGDTASTTGGAPTTAVKTLLGA